ncbi:methyltransferase domain-containing protein [Streptomyces chartreusis]|uniref:methyltransferase domain-containing protein n=1 Tax=Streptomyces chartreusis TaxID=1969 RepID=UPI002E172C9E|nr:methyltransferase domain-containing protein [Streptomyces chartreusis]
MPPDDYNTSPLSHAVPGEQQRLLLLEQVLDPISRQHLRCCRIARDWRCLEVGAGSGSIARWLAEQCPEGEVVATDMDTRFLPHRDNRMNVQVREHDVRTDNFPSSSFDLIHTRAVLIHIPERDRIIARLASWLRPGGLLVIEEPYFLGYDDCAHPTFGAALRAMARLMADTVGTDMTWARRLPATLHAHDLTVEAKTLSAVVAGGTDTPADRLWRATADQLRAALITSGLLAPEELERFYDLLDQPDFLEIAFCLSSVTARRYGQGASA